MLAWPYRVPARRPDDFEDEWDDGREEVALLDARIATFDALGHTEDAQAGCWAAFERWLSAPHLWAYLRGLPGFDDVDAAVRAMMHAASHPDATARSTP